MTAASNATKRRKTARRDRVPFVSTVHSPGRGTNPSELYRQRDKLLAVDRSLARMPAATRAALLASVEGRRLESVAAEYGIPASTLRKNVSRARAQLERELNAADKLDLLREAARRVRRGHGAEQDHSATPGFARPRDRSEDDSSVENR